MATEILKWDRAKIGEIPCLWVQREGVQPAATVLWLPGFSGTTESVRPYLEELARMGLGAMAMDPREHGERALESVDDLRMRVHGNIRRHFWPILGGTCEDVSTVLDFAQRELGWQGPVGAGGISMGGDIAVAAAAREKRIVAVAAGIATPDWLRPGSHEPPGEADAAAWEWYHRWNPLTHLDDYAAAPQLLFACGEFDTQVPAEAAGRFVNHVAPLRREPASVDLYLQPGIGHQFTPEMWRRCRHWLARHLL